MNHKEDFHRPEKDRSNWRLAQYVLILVFLFLAYALTRDFIWQGNAEQHTIMESMATTLAALAGVMALVRYYSKKETTYLLIGAGFLATAFFDFYHTIATGTQFSQIFASLEISLSPWSWFASRLFLSVLLLSSWYYWWREKNTNRRIVSDISLYLSITAFTIAGFAFFIFFPLPAAYFPEQFFSRPADLIPGAIFFLAAVGYLSKGGWRNNFFEHWLILALILASIGQILFAPFSKELYDLEFNVAHILKALSYAFVLIGLLGSTYKSFREIEEDHQALSTQNLKLEAAKLKDEAILKSIGDGLVLTDQKRRIMMMNRVGEEMTGYKEKEVVGKLWPEIVCPHAADKKKTLKEMPIGRVLSSSPENIASTSLASDIYLTKKDKAAFPVSVTASLVKTDDKNVGAIIVFRDVTHEKEIDKAKTEFVSLASHQLRTPLSTIKWYAEMLDDGEAGKLTVDQKKLLKEIKVGNQRMVELVNSLLNVSRIELGTFLSEPEQTDVIKLAKKEVGELKQEIAKKKIKFNQYFDKQIPQIPVDPKLMGIVFQNLLTNAVKYTPRNGRVSMTVNLCKKGTKLNGKPVASDSICMQVTDTGYGIPVGQQKHIFEKLFRADNIKEKDTVGSGLGLYMTKSIIEHADGDIWFDSSKNKGSSFYVTIPLSGMPKKKGTRHLEKAKV